MTSLVLDDRSEALLAPVRPALDAALDRLPGGGAVHVIVGRCPGTHAVSVPRVTLSEGLLDGVHHPDEPPGPLPPMDRWRRALGSVLEGVAHAGFGARWESLPRWARFGAAIHAADRAAPELGLADPELAVAIQAGSPAAHPRSGVAVLRAWEAEGVSAEERLAAWVAGEGPTPAEWTRLGSWVFDAAGLRAQLPIDVAPVPAVDVPTAVQGGSWVRLDVPAHPRGGFVRVEGGGGAVASPWAAGGERLRTVAGALEDCRLVPESGGPVGRWEVASAEGFGQVMGARGVTYGFRADGTLEIVMADAFVGPLDALEMAEQVGTSGLCGGRWRVHGPFEIAYSDLDTSRLTMHGRQREFMMPAQGFGMNQWLQALDEHPWAWSLEGGRLRMTGRLLGGSVIVWLSPASTS